VQLDLDRDWPAILAYVDQAMKATYYVALATVDPDGVPTVTPIGSLVLNADRTGFFLERFPRTLGRNAEQNKNFCFLAENTRKWQILQQVRKGGYFGVKLTGVLGERRPATPADVTRINHRIRFTRRKRAEQMLLGDAPQVRDLTVTRGDAIILGYDKANRTFTGS
jgi:hypothetical protein